MKEKEYTLEIKPRGKGKIKEVYTNRTMYRYYKSVTKPYERYEIVSEPVFNAFLKDLNDLLIERIVIEGEVFKMPYRLGKLKIKAFDSNIHRKPVNFWPVDHKKSKEAGFRVYHDNKETYRWKWEKKRTVVKWQSVYCFKPSRNAKRKIAFAVKNLNKTYFFE